jgi:protein-disulfide isomerase
MKQHFFPLAVLSLALVACVDTTGLSDTSSKTPHPSTEPNAIVTVTEFGDLQCPACKAAQTMIVEPLIQKYGKQIRFEFHQFPLSSIHRYAMEAAEASECAADQGKFWEFVDMAYEKQDELNSDAITQWGKEIGVDEALFERCRASHIKRDLIETQYDQGRTLGVDGTPTFFVNDTQVPATIEALSEAIDKGLGAGMAL